MKPARKMQHMIFANEVHVWVKSVYETEFKFLKRGGFLDQMKSYKTAFDSPSQAKVYALSIVEDKIKNQTMLLGLFKDLRKVLE